jgi:peptidoglycan hydrolase CwlO-like protein
MATKEEYQAKMEAQLKDIAAKLAELLAKADKATAEAKVQYQEQIKHLRAKLQETQGRLQQLKASSGEAWVVLKDGTEKAWGELRGAMDNALAKFR